MRTPQGIIDLIIAHRQHVSLSFINDALEFCVGNVSFCMVQHVIRRIPLILKESQSAYGMMATVQRNTECTVLISFWPGIHKARIWETRKNFGW